MVRFSNTNIAQDYYPFGMLMPGRSYSSTAYKYGFNGQEKDDEVYGTGNLNTAEFWEYDTRLGRRWNVDPVVQSDVSGYACFNNNPIMLSDPDGDTPGDKDPPKPECNGSEEGETLQTSVSSRANLHGIEHTYTTDWVWHTGSKDNEKGWYSANDYYNNILKPVAKSYNDFMYSNGDGALYFDYANYDRLHMHNTIMHIAADLKANPTYDGWKSYLPIWGSYQQAKLDESVGKTGSMVFNSILAGSDAALLRSILWNGGKYLLKGGASNGFKWWSSWRRWYGKNGFAESGEQMHHWLLHRDGAKFGIGFEWKLKNSPWNLITMKDSKLLGLTGSQIHTLIHGGTVNGRTWNNLMGVGFKYIYGTPTWFKTSINYGIGKVYNSTR